MQLMRQPSRFWKRCEGVAALEFALILPVLLLMFFASLELAMALDCRTRVVDATASTADLIAQRSSVSAGDLKNILCATKAVISPYSTTGTIKMVVSGITCKTYGSSCTAKQVSWSSYTTGAAARTAVPDNGTLPLDMFTSSSSGAVMAEMTYTYTPVTTQFLAKSITLHWTAYAIPRTGSAVSGVNVQIADCSLGS